ncbi:MAG TPA: hypothetical protein DCZ05_03700, partial [Deltaproteobacteria bacterium]|nr:hypothetical protein [Deltaproteobacteria bacterium]
MDETLTCLEFSVEWGVSKERIMGTMDGVVLSSSEVEVMAKPVRRRFTGEYKLKILGEAEASSGSGQIGALLRREGLYSSNLTQKDGVRSWILYFTY